MGGRTSAEPRKRPFAARASGGSICPLPPFAVVVGFGVARREIGPVLSGTGARCGPWLSALIFASIELPKLPHQLSPHACDGRADPQRCTVGHRGWQACCAIAFEVGP